MGTPRSICLGLCVEMGFVYSLVHKEMLLDPRNLTIAIESTAVADVDLE